MWHQGCVDKNTYLATLDLLQDFTGSCTGLVSWILLSREVMMDGLIIIWDARQRRFDFNEGPNQKLMKQPISTARIISQIKKRKSRPFFRKQVTWGWGPSLHYKTIQHWQKKFNLILTILNKVNYLRLLPFPDPSPVSASATTLPHVCPKAEPSTHYTHTALWKYKSVAAVVPSGTSGIYKICAWTRQPWMVS